MSESIEDKAKDVIEKVGGPGAVDHLIGSAKETIGHAKESIGHAVGNKDLAADGAVDQAEGKAHHALGDVKDMVHDVAVEIKEQTAHAVGKAADAVKHLLHKDED